MTARHWHPLCVLLAAGAVLLAGCGGGNAVAPPELPTVASQDLWAELFSGSPPRVIDVRDACDYDLGHLPGSESKPGGRSPAVLAASRANDDIVIVGNTELDARRAAAALPGGDTARALQGGMQAWDCGLDINDVQLKQWMDSGRNARFIDVRTYAEWWNERIGGTENRPLDQLAAWVTTIAPADEVVLICGSGVRSVLARDELAGRGFTRMHNLVGGLAAWGYETVCG